MTAEEFHQSPSLLLLDPFLFVVRSRIVVVCALGLVGSVGWSQEGSARFS